VAADFANDREGLRLCMMYRCIYIIQASSCTAVGDKPDQCPRLRIESWVRFARSDAEFRQQNGVSVQISHRSPRLHSPRRSRYIRDLTGVVDSAIIDSWSGKRSHERPLWTDRGIGTGRDLHRADSGADGTTALDKTPSTPWLARSSSRFGVYVELEGRTWREL
jgi:hypothetical protein